MFFLSACHSAVLDPKGMIALQERGLLITAVSLILLIVLPVIFLVFFIAIKYRATNLKAHYQPEWTHSAKLEIIWWTIPSVL